MSMFLIAAAAALNASVPENIDIVQANWSSYPRLVTDRVDIPNSDMIGSVERLLRRSECAFEGQSDRRFNISVNYGVELDGQGNATRIVVEDVGCRPLEHLVGRIAAEIVARGFVRTPAPSERRIFANTINFNLR